MARSRTLIIGNANGDDVPYKEGEVASGETVYPGMLLEQTGENARGEPLLAPVSSVDKDTSVRLALTPESPPKNTDADIPREHEYTAGEHIQYQVLRPGDVVQNGLLADGGVLSSASDADVSIGDGLGTNDDGTMKATTTAGAILAEATEAVDNSTGGGGEGGVDAARIAYEVV